MKNSITFYIIILIHYTVNAQVNFIGKIQKINPALDKYVDEYSKIERILSRDGTLCIPGKLQKLSINANRIIPTSKYMIAITLTISSKEFPFNANIIVGTVVSRADPKAITICILG